MLSLIVLKTPKRVNWTGRLGPITNRPRYELQLVVDALNGKIRPEQILGEEDALREERKQKETPNLLREIVQRWQSSGPYLFRFSVDNRKLWGEVKEYWKQIPVQLVGAPTGGAAFWWNPRPSRDPREEALRWFMQLLLNPECNRLAGPCERCNSFYIRKSARNKRYCSRSCGTKATAIAATKKARMKEHENKLLRAREAIGEYPKARTKMDWKKWVSLKERAIGITPKFLTRAVNNGELNGPKGT